MSERSGLARQFRPLLRGREHRSAMSLPTRTFTVGEINVGPILCTRDEALSNGIVENVVCLLAPAFFATQPVFEEVTLPRNAELFCSPLLPLAHDRLESLLGGRKRNQRMHVIGHNQKKMRPPQAFLLPMLNGFEKRFSNMRQRQLIRPAYSTIDRDEINFLLWIDPKRHLVRQSLAAGNLHERENRNAVAQRNAIGRDGALRRSAPRTSGATWDVADAFGSPTIPPAATRAGTSQRDVPTCAREMGNGGWPSQGGAAAKAARKAARWRGDTPTSGLTSQLFP